MILGVTQFLEKPPYSADILNEPMSSTLQYFALYLKYSEINLMLICQSKTVWGSEVWKNRTLPFIITMDLVLSDWCGSATLPTYLRDPESTLKASGISGSQLAWYPKPLWPFGLQSACVTPSFTSRTQGKQVLRYMCHAQHEQLG